MKRLLILASAAALLCGLTGCAQESSAPASSVQEMTYADMSELAKTMKDADPDLPDMLTVTDSDEEAETNFLSITDDLSFDKVAHYLLIYSSEGKCEEIAVIALKDQADTEAAKAALEKHLDTRRHLFAQYHPEEVPRMKNAEVFTSGAYAVLTVCQHPDAVKAAFEQAVG